MLNKIIVIGSGNSGSGAVFDYLSSQKSNLSFLNGKEFRIIHDPDGLTDLYINNYVNFSINNSASAFERFKKVLDKFEKKNKQKKLRPVFKKFFNKVIRLNYNAYPEFYKNRIYFKKKLNFYVNRVVFKKKIKELELMNMTLPVEEKKFIKESQILINNIIKIIHKNNIKFKNVIFNQSANYWNINLSTKFFDNKKIIIVDRDPRSIFWSMKRTEAFSYPGHDVNTFIKWYKEIQIKFDKNIKNKNNILQINYENFLNNFDKERKKINKFICVSNNDLGNFDKKNSMKNLYKAKNFLTKNELNKIEIKLKKYLKW